MYMFMSVGYTFESPMRNNHFHFLNAKLAHFCPVVVNHLSHIVLTSGSYSLFIG